MINITNNKARNLYLAEFGRQMNVLENTFIKELRPLLGRQFLNAAKLVQNGITFEGVNHAVDLGRRRLITMLAKHQKRVATVFSRKAYNIIENSQKSITPSELKTPKDEFWMAIGKWGRERTAESARQIQGTTKEVISKIIQKGMNDELGTIDIAKLIRATSTQINPHRARTIALTETHTAAVKAVDTAVASTRIEFEREWVSARDMRTRRRGLKGGFEHYATFPLGANRERVKQKEKFKGTGEMMEYPGDPSGSGGNVIRCLTSYKTAIYTSDGWKRVKDIAVGDLVLTHKNRFKRVLRLNQSLYEGEVVTITLDGQGKSITVTPNHPFLITPPGSKFSRWKEAKDIGPGDIVSFMASYCQWCGKAIPYYLKYCDITCSSKATTDRQWKDPKHRKNMSKKAAAQMKREYINGTRDRFEITKKARKAQIDKYGPGGPFTVLTKDPEFQKNRITAINKKYGSVFEMLKKTAFPALGRKNFGGSKIEQAMAKFLDKNNRDFVAQFPVNRRRIDFYVKAEKLFIEVDGFPWHEDKEGERKRDLEILTKYPDHQIAHVDYKMNPPKWEFFDLVALNHTGTFAQVGMKVRSVTKRQLISNIKTYNLAVEDDESYIAKGFVNHNCRCVLLYHAVRVNDKLKPYNPEG